MKRTVVLIALLLAALTLAACTPAEKLYSDKGFNITLPGNFRPYDAEAYDVCFENNKCVVFALREPFDAADGFGGLTLKEYAEIVLEANGLDEPITETDKYVYFEYEGQDGGEGEPYLYLACCFKAEDAFWLVQFSALKSDYAQYRDRMLGWGDTVYFTE